MELELTLIRNSRAKISETYFNKRRFGLLLKPLSNLIQIE